MEHMHVSTVAQITIRNERITRRLITYNVNSIIAAIGRKDGKLLEFIDNNRADVIALQETMINPVQKMNGDKWRLLVFIRRVKKLGYHVFWNPGTRNHGGYGGTLFLTLVEPEHVIKGTGNTEVDNEGRFITLIFADSIIVNSYTPTLSLELTGQKRKDDFWIAAKHRYKNILEKFPNRPVVWLGDMNCAPEQRMRT
jgi:exodeoxyribonuclease III